MAEARGSDEAVVFSRDAKLLRCRTNEWKDRGNGKAVLFLHPATGRLRFSMRRLQQEQFWCRPGFCEVLCTSRVQRWVDGASY